MGSPATVEGHVEVPGGRIWYRIAGADRPGTPLLCLHGGPGMPHDYLEPLEDLAVSRPVVFYDQLGCGRSDRPADDSLWTTDRFVEELAVVHAALGLERPHLFGNSWGGWLALQYTLDRTPALASLILSSSPPSVARWITDCAGLRAMLDEPVRRSTARSSRRAGQGDPRCRARDLREQLAHGVHRGARALSPGGQRLSDQGRSPPASWLGRREPADRAWVPHVGGAKWLRWCCFITPRGSPLASASSPRRYAGRVTPFTSQTCTRAGSSPPLRTASATPRRRASTRSSNAAGPPPGRCPASSFTADSRSVSPRRRCWPRHGPVPRVR